MILKREGKKFKGYNRRFVFELILFNKIKSIRKKLIDLGSQQVSSKEILSRFISSKNDFPKDGLGSSNPELWPF